MERESFVVNGGVKMPIGYRFVPTEEELVVCYLMPKVMNLPLPASVIPDFDLILTDPWILPGELSEKRRYFFSKCGKVNGVDCNFRRATGSGYWKTIGKQKVIFGPESNKVVGTRKPLVFKQKKKHVHHASKTRWFLHQFSLLSSSTPTETEVEDWVVCRLFQKRRKGKKSDGLNLMEMEKSSDDEIGPCSSGVTDQDCSTELPSLHQEASSTSINVFS